MTDRARRTAGSRARVVVACTATAALLAPLIWWWQHSLLPDSFPVTGMGYMDVGGGPAGAMATGHGGHAPSDHGGRSVTSLVADVSRRADVSVTLTARKEPVRLASGRSVDGYTLNGHTPGPLIRAAAGQLVQVRLVNASVPDGVTLHWHGLDVPGAEDGVAGVTQDAVAVGREFTYRFVPRQVGTFWYHSHQNSREQVGGGLLGALVITPATTDATAGARSAASGAVRAGPTGDEVDDIDVPALVHIFGGVRTINGLEGSVPVPAAPGRRARVRVINTENGQMPVWVAGASFRVLAVDGHDLTGAGQLANTAVPVAGGGRVDLEVTLPSDGSRVRVQIGGPEGLVLGSGQGAVAPVATRPGGTLDLLSYGRPAPLGFDPDRPDRRFGYDVGRRPGFLDGRPGMWWTINGHLFPDVPMFVVREGDVVRMRISNHSGEAHPMHLHGHHAVVLARDGRSATGSPWWTDSLTVAEGESYDIAFVADNPGIWVDHCHNLPHAGEGLLAHVMYEGVTTPFVLGGAARNTPE